MRNNSAGLFVYGQWWADGYEMYEESEVFIRYPIDVGYRFYSALFDRSRLTLLDNNHIFEGDTVLLFELRIYDPNDVIAEGTLIAKPNNGIVSIDFVEEDLRTVYVIE
jgi:hypothetical protein